MISISALNDSTSASSVRAPSLMEEAMRERLRHAHAEYRGFQEGYKEMPGFHLWNLLHDIPGHPEGSTIAQGTLDAFLFA